MKTIFRKIIGFVVVLPFAIITHIGSIFIGKQKMVEKFGPWVTAIAKSTQQFFPPKIHHASEFDIFKEKVKSRQKIWRLLYDYPIEFPDEDTVLLTTCNCPFVEAIKTLKISELGPYACQGDFEVAKDNAHVWKFERKCQIGTGDNFCDFKYMRIKEVKNER